MPQIKDFHGFLQTKESILICGKKINPEKLLSGFSIYKAEILNQNS